MQRYAQEEVDRRHPERRAAGEGDPVEGVLERDQDHRVAHRESRQGHLLGAAQVLDVERQPEHERGRRRDGEARRHHAVEVVGEGVGEVLRPEGEVDHGRELDQQHRAREVDARPPPLGQEPGRQEQRQASQAHPEQQQRARQGEGHRPVGHRDLQPPHVVDAEDRLGGGVQPGGERHEGVAPEAGDGRQRQHPGGRHRDREPGRLGQRAGAAVEAGEGPVLQRVRRRAGAVGRTRRTGEGRAHQNLREMPVRMPARV